MKNKYIKIGHLSISLLYIDLFCGAGGTSTGIEAAQVKGEKCAKIIACVNHDANAIASHAKNHPEAVHYTEDIRTLELSPLVEYKDQMKALYPFAKVIIWASLECTNHSKAKGGMSRDADSRTLADHLFRYIDALDPDSVQIENVEEFLIWGPLMEKVVHKKGTTYCPLTISKKVSYRLEPVYDKLEPKIITKKKTSYCPLKKVKIEDVSLLPTWVPIKERKAEFYKEWVKKVKECGYDYDYKILNAADFGAYTSRKRYFAQFNKPGFPTLWPVQTHAKNPVEDQFGQKLEKWKAVKDLLDFDNEGSSIFDRKKDLVEATLERFYEGLIKFVAGGKDKFLAQYNSGNAKHRVSSVDEICNTITTNNRFSLIQPKFLTAYYGNGFASSIEKPCPTVTTGDRFNILTTTFIDQQFGKSKPASINTVLGAVTTNPKYSKVDVEWVMNTNFKNVGSSIEDPAPTITANRKWHYLVDAQYSRVGTSIEKPCFTLIARMDKTPPYLIEINQNDNGLPSFIKIIDDLVIYEIYEDDSPMMKKIKEFMALYGLKDIKMRMLTIQELKEIMGFPPDYVLIGSQADQKKFIGNAVEVTVARKICEATSKYFFDLRKVA